MVAVHPTYPHLVGVDALALGLAAIHGAVLAGPSALAWATSGAGLALAAGAVAVLTASLILEPPDVTEPAREGVDYPPLRRLGGAPD